MVSLTVYVKVVESASGSVVLSVPIVVPILAFSLIVFKESVISVGGSLMSATVTVKDLLKVRSLPSVTVMEIG